MRSTLSRLLAPSPGFRSSFSQQLRHYLFVALLNRMFRRWRLASRWAMTEDLSDISGPALCFAFFIGNELANLGLVECPLLADPSRARQFSAGSHGLHCSHRQSKDWSQAVKSYHAIGRQVAKLPAKTMAGVIAKLLAAASNVTEDDLEGDAHSAILAGAALDAQALARS
jgi:hypothetical protein